MPPAAEPIDPTDPANPTEPAEPAGLSPASATIRCASSGLSEPGPAPQTSLAAILISTSSRAADMVRRCCPRPKRLCRPNCPCGQGHDDGRGGACVSRERHSDREHSEKADEQGPPGHRGTGRHDMSRRRQHDADRGEHRGSQQPRCGCGTNAHGNGHGRVIIALRPYAPWGRSGRSPSAPVRRASRASSPRRSRLVPYPITSQVTSPSAVPPRPRAPGAERLRRPIHRPAPHSRPPNEGYRANQVLTAR